MKAVILAGGRGTRIAEESLIRPKPMVEIGGRPILWHIMKIYAHYGITEFIVCLGYRGYMIKEYFANYVLHQADVTIDFDRNEIDYHHMTAEPWRVTLVETGADTQTGGRVRRVRDYIGGETFCLTYGDGVADIDIAAEIDFHKSHGRAATIAAVRPPGRYGALVFGDNDDENMVERFTEKPAGEGGLINGGFFVLDAKVIDRIEADSTVWEREPLTGLAADGELSAYRHIGFWQPMDTLREKNLLEDLWNGGDAPWKVWD